jgi:hypothetical protein
VHNETVGRELYHLVVRVPSVYRVWVFINNRAGRRVPNTVILQLPATFLEYSPQ